MPRRPTAGALLDQQYEMVATSALRLHPDNPNEGDVGAITESIATNGFYGALIVQRSTGYVIAGNHRLIAAVDQGIDTVPVIWLDVDDEQAARLLVADNRLTRIGMFVDEPLKRILTNLAMTEVGLAGTGFDGDDLDDMMREAAEPLERNRIKRFKVSVRCDDADHQAEVLNQLLGLGLDAKAV